MAATSGELCLEVSGPPGAAASRLVEKRVATAADRERVRAETALATAHEERHGHECRQGLDSYQDSQRRFAALGLPQRRAEALLALGVLARDCEENETAEAALGQAALLFAGDDEAEATVRQNLGEVRDSQGDFEGAVQEYRQALTLRRRGGDRAAEAKTAGRLALALDRLGRYDDAAPLYGRTLEAWRELGQPGERANTLINQGQHFLELGERDRASESFLAARALYRETKDLEGLATAWNKLGLLSQEEGHLSVALDQLKRALVLRSPGSREWAVTSTTIGVAYRQLGKLDHAAAAYAAALPIFRRFGDSREEAKALGNLAQMEAAEGHGPAALGHFDQALELFTGLKDAPSIAWILSGRANVLRRRGDLEAARQAMEMALAAVEEHRLRQTSDITRAGFFSTQQDLYDVLIDLLMEMHRKAPASGYDAAARDVSERARARALLDAIAASRGTAPREQANPHHAALSRSRPWSAAAVRSRLLDADTLLLEYRLGDERSFLWVLAPDSLASYELPRRADLEEEVLAACRSLARSYAGAAENSLPPRLEDLSGLLLGPVAGRLAGKRLVVVGDGALWSLPFASLPEPRKDGSFGEPLIAGHEIVYLPSISVLGELRQEARARRPAAKTLWLLANPDFGKAFGPLPYTHQEAAAILALVPAASSFSVEGREASRQAVLGSRLRDYHLLHFATHGSFGAGDPSGGRLVLAQLDRAGHKVADGFLHLDDIYKLDLRADLVVLSACQSAWGREVRGEGVMGMTRGFFYAGAERVLVSLWNVNDSATVELMQRFYQEMLQGGLAPAAALREAQDAIRRQRGRRSPYYWAGFTLQGEWRGID